MPHVGDASSLAKNKTFRLILLLLGALAVATAVGFMIYRVAQKDSVAQAEVQRPKLSYAGLHTFPDGVDEIKFPIGPTRLEGVNLPSDAVAYKIDATVWRQMITWDGKPGPVLRKGEQTYMPISRNRNISQATFWVRGEGDAEVSIERGQK